MAVRKRSSGGGGRQQQSKRVASRAERAAPIAERRHDVPEAMRAAAIDCFGGPDELTLHRLPVPVPGPTRC
jgi:hypothetical protein